MIVLLLPVSAASQYAEATGQGYLPAQQEPKDTLTPNSDFSAQSVCTWPNRDCAGNCGPPCSSGATWYCGSSNGVCCGNDAKFCADKCWTQCSSTSYIWVCTSSGAVCEPKSKCTNPSYPYPCGGSCWGSCGSGSRFECVSGSGQCKLESCTNPNYPNWCGSSCWSSCSGVFNCDNGAGKCCPSSAPYYCSKGNGCWDQTWKCDKSIECGGTWKSCGSSTDTPYCNSGSLVCCPSDKPYYWNGQCQACTQDYPNSCGGNCWKCDSPSDSFTCYNGQAKCCPSSFPNYCGKNDQCWTQSWMCDKSISCGGSWKVCGSSSEVPFCDSGLLKCCPSDKPYYRDGACRECPSDKPKQCGSNCYSGNECSDSAYPSWNCKPDGSISCCPSNFPVYCARTDNNGKDACWESSTECDNAKKCGSEGWTVCRDPASPYWNCRSDGVSRCCSPGYPYLWNSDWLCHTTPEQQVSCPVPDGSSSQCDCNSNADCQSQKPFCEENYPSPISDGYDGCVSTVPEYCGNGNCNAAKGENYNNCAADCGQNAPKGTINVDVYYGSGVNANKPISGAYVYLDSSSVGTTDNSGKKSFQASYGSRDVKVECPDRAYCGTKTVSVDGTEYASFSCACSIPITTSNLRIRLKAQTQEYPRGYPAAHVVVLIDGEKKGSTNQFGTLDIENLPGGGRRIDVQLLLLENGQEKKYTGGMTITLDESYEEQNFLLVKDQNPAAATIMVMENGKEVFTLEEASPEIVWFAVIYAVIVIGGIIWDAYDYNNCLEKNAKVWTPAQNNWNNYNCITSTSMTPDQFNDCMEKSLSRNQNSASGCEFQVTMLVLNFVPLGGAAKTLGKLGVKITGGIIKVIPHIDDAAKGLYRTYTFVKDGKIFAEVTDKAAKGAKYIYKLVDNAFKTFDNIVGLIVNEIARNPETWAKISERVDNLLLNIKPSDIPTAKLGSIPNIKGVIGEKAKDEYLNVVKEAIEKDGATVMIAKGSPGTVYKQTSKYVAEFTDTGTGLNIFPKDAQGKILRGKQTAEIDGLIIVNDKPIVIEAKAAAATNIAGDISSDLAKQQEFFATKVETIEDLIGQKPEVLLLIPKGESSVKLGAKWNPFAPKLSDKIDSLTKFLEDKGTHLAYDEFPVGVDAFENAARKINNAAKP